MSLFKLLFKSTSKHFNHSKASCMFFRTTCWRKTAKKFSLRKNNFKFQTNFQNSKNKIQKEYLVELQQEVETKEPNFHHVTRALKYKENFTSENHRPVKSPPKQNKEISRNKKTLSLLQYKGELLFGIHPVYLALLLKKRCIFQLFLRTSNEESLANSNIKRKGEIEDMAKEQGIPVKNVSSKEMKLLAPGLVHQGVCLNTSSLPLPEWQEAESQNENEDTSKNFPIWLVLNEILDPMNVGAVLRSAYYFGISKVFVVKDNSCKLSPTVSKASSGALEVLNMYQIENLQNFIQIKKMKGWNIISTVAYCEEDTSCSFPVVDVTELSVTKPTILLLGNEGRGIPSEIQSLCDTFVSIPPSKTLHQGIDSLNVSVAAGVILYALSTKAKNPDCF